MSPQDSARKILYIPDSRWTWAFVLVAFVQTIATLALEGYAPQSQTDTYWNANADKHVHSYVFANFQVHIDKGADSETQSKTIPTFLALYIFGFIYELVLAYDALRLKNTIQVIGLCACNIGLLVYGAVQAQQIKDAVLTLEEHHKISPAMWPESKPFLIAIPILVALGSVVMIFIAYKLADEFAWTIYKHISADLRMKRRYLAYQVRSIDPVSA